MLPPLPGTVVPFSLDLATAMFDLTLGLILGLIGLLAAPPKMDRVLRRGKRMPTKTAEVGATRERHV